MSSPIIEYPWYRLVNEPSLQQGDLIEDHELYYGYDREKKEAKVDKFDLIVMTQSCDLMKKSTSHVVLCPIIALDLAAEKWPALRNDTDKEKVRRGQYIHFHLLNECNLKDFERPFQLVNFQRIFEAPKSDLLSFIRNRPRLRLLPPYREHLAQAFARFFMRVGLPADIPPFV